MKWYNIELAYNAKESISRADNFRFWLADNNFKAELSACGDMVHFEILANKADLPKINKALDEIVWFDAI